ncbi:hypothetical protein H4R26_000731 [Coemansia thaxteri]|uniref:Dymeclin n=1 Tax=Coemansia thaxteri TaxID=2663907 RepID=A0A9W8ELU5_9FUNG|nr:hypothetical protein H4R26_000731 [Coemansia thaxteri]
MSGAQAGRQAVPRIVVPPPEIQVPHMAKMAQQSTTKSKKPADTSLHSGGISRAQLNEPLSMPSPYSGGASATFTRSPASEHKRLPQLSSNKRIPPSTWDESLTAFMERFCSPHPLGLESLSVWHDEIAKMTVPDGQTRQVGHPWEQWCEAEGYIKHLALQLADNSPLTGNLNWAMFHFLVNMRCLKAVDFLSDVDSAVRNLQFILRIALKGLCLTLGSDRLTKVLADRPLSSGTIDLIAEKCGAMENGEVRAYAFRQTVADPSKLYRQVLHYIVLAVSRLDIRGSQSAYAFHQDLLAMLLDIVVPQRNPSPDEPAATNVFVCELLEVVGPANTFNVECSQAEMLTRSLLSVAVDSPSAPSAQGLVLSAYSYLFSRQSASMQSKQLEQQSLILLLLLVSQPVKATIGRKAVNPFMLALANIRDASEFGANRLDGFGALAQVPFPKLFAKLVAEMQSVEWTLLFQVLVSRNEAFRTYVLSRTDADTLVMPLLRRISMATALPISSSSTHTQQASKRSGGGDGGGSSGRKQGDNRHPSAALAHPKAAEHGASPYMPLATEPAIRGIEQPTYPRTAPPATSPAAKHSSGSTAAMATATASSGNPLTSSSPRSKVRLASLLPYAITVDNMPYVHLYLWLDVMLSLSSDAPFVEQLGRTPVEFWPSLPQPMHRQPLSHCIVAEAMRVFQLNIMQLKDSHIHRQSMGILSNILNETTNVSTAIAQKLVKLFDMIYKRYSKLASVPGGDVEELDVYTETLTALLAVFGRLINTNNPHFIYCLLQARDILGAFREDHGGPGPDGRTSAGIQRAVSVAAEVRVRIAYFHARISALPSGAQSKEILQLIESVVAVESGRSSGIRVDFVGGPQEDNDSQWTGFMLPMVWELLLSSSIATVDDMDATLLEEFERLVL